ncbi:MAG TPA: hypothetical protein VNQ79_15815 [Blastocatellia bacterium]|nr:hypothetical protein [Blastocatellia bacterium]
MCCASTCPAQDRTRPAPAPIDPGRRTVPRTVEPDCEARLVESLPDGSKIVLIGGAEYRAITADQMRRLLRAEAEAQQIRRERELLSEQISLLKQALELSRQSEARADEQIRLLTEQNDSFRQTLEKANTVIKRGRVDGFFNRPVVQIVTKGVLPLLAAILSARN